MALNGFSVLLFVPAAAKILAEKKRTIYFTFCSLLLRLELSYNPNKNKVTMTCLPHYTTFQIRKGKELTG